MRRARPKSARPAFRWSVALQPTLLFGGGGSSRARRAVFLDELYPQTIVAFGALPDDTENPTFSAYVEMWRSDVRDQAGTLPINFLLAWIQVESNGNPCSWTNLSEAGIFQLMPPDNISQGGTTLAAQHPVPPCANGSQTTATRQSLTDDQAYEQVRGGIQYVNFCRTQAQALLEAYGYYGQPGWTDNDWSYWAMVKMWHVLPGRIPQMLKAGSDGNGGIPADWDAMAQYVSASVVPANWLNNAREVGLFGQGGGSIVTALTSSKVLGFVLIGGGALALLYLAKKNRLVGV